LRFAVLCIAAVLVACASAPDRLAPYVSDPIDLGEPDGGAGAIGADAAQPDGDRCAAPSTGCPCEIEGEYVVCGVVHDRIGDYVRCSPAFRTCRGGVWGDCVGDRVVGGR
jgi:hypothetical protein